jgi:hypothetical protein
MRVEPLIYWLHTPYATCAATSKVVLSMWSALVSSACLWMALQLLGKHAFTICRPHCVPQGTELLSFLCTAPEWRRVSHMQCRRHYTCHCRGKVLQTSESHCHFQQIMLSLDSFKVFTRSLAHMWAIILACEPGHQLWSSLRATCLHWNKTANIRCSPICT